MAVPELPIQPPKEAVKTRSGPHTTSLSMKTKVRPADSSGSTIQGISALSKESKKTEDGLRTDGKTGNPDTPPQIKPTGRKERIAQAHAQSGTMVGYTFLADQGYFSVASNAASTVPALAAFLDTYRSDQTRAFIEKGRYPIANMQVVRRNSSRSKANLTSRIIMPQNTRFFLTGVSMATRDKVQMVKTFKSFRLFTYDGDPQVWSFQGILLNTENHNWLTEFRAAYAQYLSPSQCARNNSEVVLQFQDFYLSGLITDTQSSLSANQDGGVPLQFNMILTAEMSLATSSILQKTTRYISANTGRRVSGLTASLIFEDFARTYGQPEARSGSRVMTPERIKKLDKDMQKTLEDLIKDPNLQQSFGGV